MGSGERQVNLHIPRIAGMSALLASIVGWVLFLCSYPQLRGQSLHMASSQPRGSWGLSSQGSCAFPWCYLVSSYMNSFMLLQLSSQEQNTLN